MKPLSLSAGNDADVWEVFDRLVDDIARLAKSGSDRESFDRELLRRSVDALSALGGVIWEIRSGAFSQRAVYVAVDAIDEATDIKKPLDPAHRELLEQCASRKASLDCNTRAGWGNATKLTDSHDVIRILSPVVVDQVTIAVLELLIGANIGIDARQGASRLLSVLADSTADFHRELQRRMWRERAAGAEQFDDFVAALYQRLDSSAVAYVAAHEGRRWSECDRVDIVLTDGVSSRTLAVSGVDLVDRRSESIRRLERLVAAVAHDGDVLWFSDESRASKSPRIAQALTAYVDHVDAASLVVLPLNETEDDDRSAIGTNVRASVKRTPFAAIVFERFASQNIGDDAWRDRLQTIAKHARIALQRALECESIPLGNWWRRQYRHRTRLARRALRISVIAAAVAVAIAIPFLIPAESVVEARGRLEPERRQELFAPADGIVVEVAAIHGKSVEAGDVLVVLRRPELTVELNRVAGELQVSERRLSGLRASRTFDAPRDAASQIRTQDRSAEEEQLKESVRSLTEQHRLLLRQVDDLTIKAPFAATITTWDVEKTLPGRPVARGQPLLGLADVTGSWELDLLVPEKLIGDLLESRSSQSEPLQVDFTLATNPGKTYHGRVLRIAETTESDLESGIVVKTTVSIDREEINVALLRPGAVTTARINCGPSTLGSVWTRDLRRVIRSWWW